MVILEGPSADLKYLDGLKHHVYKHTNIILYSKSFKTVILQVTIIVYMQGKLIILNLNKAFEYETKIQFFTK